MIHQKEADMIAARRHFISQACISGYCGLCREIAQLRMWELGHRGR